jgi:beta-phosphoglucomutase-like phosphatase (HAD superfamily)
VFEDSINGLRSGRSANMVVIGLTTTNKKSNIEMLSDCQINDYTQFKYQNLNALWQAI